MLNGRAGSPDCSNIPASTAAPDRSERLAHEAFDAIRSLAPAYRETLVLRLVEGLTGPEIAERTGLTPDSVRVNLHRGFKLLREKLGGDPTVVNGPVRLERPQGHRFVPSLIETFAGQITAVTVGKPSLEDVFIHLTGHRFWEEDAASGAGSGRGPR